MEYFYLTWTDDEGGIAHGPDGLVGSIFAVTIKDVNILPFEFHLIGVAQDYLGNTLGWPLMSQRMKAIVVSIARSDPSTDWIEVRIDNGTKYYIPRFDGLLDILDSKKTLFAGGDFVVKAHLALDKIRNYDFFALPDLPITNRLIVSKSLKIALLNQNITGINFSRVPVG